jgi:CRP/FNR family transcriptional regulator
VNTPYGLEIIEDCVAFPLHKDRVFCNLSKDSITGLDAISSSATYPKGAVLFMEGQESRGVFILRNGRVKLFGASATGKSVIFWIAEAGEIVGLPSTLSSKPYEATAEALEPIHVNFIGREHFLSFLRTHGDVSLKVFQMLSATYYATCQEIRYLGLATRSIEKLALFLLDLKPAHGSSPTDQKFLLALTHDEIASTIGTSRETVTRLFTTFRRKRLIEIHGSVVTFLNKKSLQKLARS